MHQKKIVIFGQGCPVMRAAIQALMGAGYRVLVASPQPFNPFIQDTSPKIGQLSTLACTPCDEEKVNAAMKGATAVFNFSNLPFETAHNPHTHTLLEATSCLARAAKKGGVSHFFHMAPLISQEGATTAYEHTHILAQEELLTLFPKATILRCGLIYGRQEHFFTPTAAMATVLPVVGIFGSKDGKFQPLYVDDLTRALLTLLKTRPTKGRIYELAGPDVYTLEELIHMTMRLCGRKALIMGLPKSLGRLMVWAKRALGYPLISLGEVPLLHSDAHTSHSTPGLKELGLTPTPLTSILPHLLTRFKPHF